MSTVEAPGAELDGIASVIRSRRSSLVMDRDRELGDDLVERLCGLITHAPNHKRTAPWQVAVFTGAGRAALGKAFRVDAIRATTGEPVPQTKLDSIEAKYLRAPAVVVVGCQPDPEPLRHREDLYAVAAGVQNLLLGASASGLAALWSSPPVIAADNAGRLAGFVRDTEIVAVIYIGWPSGTPTAADRPAPTLHWCRTE